MTHLFLNGGGMSGGPLHPLLGGAPLVTRTRTAPRYRFYVVAGRFPALVAAEQDGVAVAGEVYDLPLTTLRDALLPAEPPELELGIIELDDAELDGGAALGFLLRREYNRTAELTDISAIADWRAYVEGRR